MTRVDRKVWSPEAECFRTFPHAWFVTSQDAVEFARTFANDPFNIGFCFDIVEE